MPHFDSEFFDTAQDGTNRSVARADVAELSAAITPAVQKEADHHLVVVSTKKVLSSTQFKQMFYSRGDDYFQIANVYECPDSGQSVLDSVWGIATDHVDYNIAGDFTSAADFTNVGDIAIASDFANSVAFSSVVYSTHAGSSATGACASDPLQRVVSLRPQ